MMGQDLESEEKNKELIKIDQKYEEKLENAINSVTEKYDTIIDKIKTKLEKKYREITETLKLKRDLNSRLSELKILLKLFKKEAHILTKNKQKELDQKIHQIEQERELKMAEIKEKEDNFPWDYRELNFF